MRKFKLSRKVCENLELINGRYHVLCFELTDEEDFSEFFELCEELALEPRDRCMVEYASKLWQLCHSYDSPEEFRKEADVIFNEYIAKLGGCVIS